MLRVLFGLSPGRRRKKNLKLFAEVVYKNDSPINSEQDTAKMGYLTGTVCDTLFAKLDRIIRTIEIDALSFNNENCCDGSVITIIVYCNGKRKYLKSMFPPANAQDPIVTLEQINTINERTWINLL